MVQPGSSCTWLSLIASACYACIPCLCLCTLTKFATGQPRASSSLVWLAYHSCQPFASGICSLAFLTQVPYYTLLRCLISFDLASPHLTTLVPGTLRLGWGKNGQPGVPLALLHALTGGTNSGGVAMDRQITCQVALLSPWVAQSRQLHLLLQLLLWLRLLLLQEKVSMVLSKTLPPQDGCRVVFQKPIYGQGPSILPIVRV